MNFLTGGDKMRSGLGKAIPVVLVVLASLLGATAPAIAQEAAGVNICQQAEEKLAACTSTLNQCAQDVVRLGPRAGDAERLTAEIATLRARIAELEGRPNPPPGAEQVQCPTPSNPYGPMVREAVDRALGPIKERLRDCEALDVSTDDSGRVMIAGRVLKREEVDKALTDLKRTLPGLDVDAERLRRLQECLARLIPGWGYERGQSGPRVVDRGDITRAQLERLPTDCLDIGARLDTSGVADVRKASEGFWARDPSDGYIATCEKGADGKWAFSRTNPNARRNMLILKEAGND